MKISILAIAIITTIVTVFTSCKNAATADSASSDSTVVGDTANYTTIQWIDSIKDIGTLEKGKVAEIKFAFKNTGDKPLYIISAQPGCGCTVADYPKEAISPNGEGVISANYDSDRGSMGEFRKSVTVTTNTKNGSKHYIFLRGNVVEKGGSALNKKPAPDTNTLR